MPIMVDDLMCQNQLKVSVLRSTDKWFGMTYKEDRALVMEELKMLHEDGLYPKTLRDSE